MEPYDSSKASRHKISHFLPLFLAACGGTSTTRMASSKTFFSLVRVRKVEVEVEGEGEGESEGEGEGGEGEGEGGTFCGS